jgi:glucose/arabinose dehydrogenase
MTMGSIELRHGRNGIALALAALLAVLLLAPASSAAEPELPTGFQDSLVFSGLEQPTAVRFAPNGMVFVAEKAGKIKVFSDTEDDTPDLFKDLRTEVYDHGDRGLLGLAVDPDFPASPYVYALFTYDHVLGESAPPPKWGQPNDTGDFCPAAPANGSDDCLVSGRLVRYTATVSEDGGGLHAIASGEKALIPEDWCQQFSSHSIGDLHFGPEGALYASAGDGASYGSPDYGELGNPPNPCGDPPEEGGSMRAQDVRTPETLSDPTGLDGAIIRIDPETGAGWPGNPLSSSLSANERRIVAHGFRNPFRFAIDPQNGEVYADNVGASEFEEIDRFDPSEPTLYNSGWPCFEGMGQQFQFKYLELPICEGMYEEAGSASTPFFHYSHRMGVTLEDECTYNNGSALAGLTLYKGEEFPAAYEGALFFADSVRSCIYVMLPGSDGRPDPTQVQGFLAGGSSLYPGVDIQEGPDGALYYTSLFGEDFSDGSVRKITYVPGAPQARLEADTTYSKDLSHVYQLDASGSTDPDEGALEFEWDLDGDGTFETEGGETQEESYGSPDNVVVSVRVTDGEGLVSVARLTLYPGDEPPVVTIEDPAPGTEWAVGDTIDFYGTAVDSEGAGIYSRALHWGTRILHCPSSSADCHSHPLQVFPGVEWGEVVAPEHDYPSFIEITFTATDRRGLSGSKTIKLPAKGVTLRVESQPPGIPLTAGNVSAAAPFNVSAIQNSPLTLAAPETAELNGTTYAWQSWSDGGDRNHSIVASSSATYTATYAALPPKEEPPTEEEPPAEEKPPAEEEPPAGGGSPGGSPPPLPPSDPPEVSATFLGKHPRKATRATAARFTFSSTEAAASFRCKLDAKAIASCHSPKVYKRLEPGRHTFKVWATAGLLADPTPATFSWKVLPRK